MVVLRAISHGAEPQLPLMLKPWLVALSHLPAAQEPVAVVLSHGLKASES